MNVIAYRLWPFRQLRCIRQWHTLEQQSLLRNGCVVLGNAGPAPGLLLWTLKLLFASKAFGRILPCPDPVGKCERQAQVTI